MFLRQSLLRRWPSPLPHVLLLSMPLDTVKTSLQVSEGEGRPTIGQTIKKLVKEGGLGACYRCLGPRWASMPLSATIMITTNYEFIKKMSTKNQEESRGVCLT